MSKLLAKIAGIILLIAGVAAAILHYALEEDLSNSWLTLGIAAVLLVAGWALFDWGAGISARRRRQDGK
jgi:4-amino-4-deoxy-L-arabinose transferase-like glycosyltransferase